MVPDPVAATEKVADCPARTDWLYGGVVMVSGVMPVPLREMASGELEPPAAIMRLPVTTPVAWGTNWI